MPPPAPTECPDLLDRATWKVRDRELPLSTPIVMGILNVTPDSFSDGGAHADPHASVEAGLAMVAAGAAIVDIGGESTRPRATPVDAAEELTRILPVVSLLADEGVVVSVDTSKPDVALAAIDAGAVIVNDVTGLTSPSMIEVCAATGVGVVIMHMQGVPATMQDDPTYGDVVADVRGFLAGQCLRAIAGGIRIESIAIDPGIGFGKTFEHNLELLHHLDAFTHLGYPVLVGTSRKGFLGTILEPVRGPTRPDERDAATAATVAAAVLQGASILRVHNVALCVDVALTAKAMVRTTSHDEATNRT
jgi:dihydropteroate synthase